MKTLQDFDEDNCKAGISHIRRDDLRKEAMIWVKTNEGEISIADWIEFFNIEKEFADECVCGDSRSWHDMKGDESCRVDVADDPEINCDCKKFVLKEEKKDGN